MLVEKSPPSVVIVGIEPKLLEEPLLEVAVKEEWERQDYSYRVIAYFKP
ncbi:MAG: hypothetical protein ABII09_10245 [Planctomycetota bacterium]